MNAILRACMRLLDSLANRLEHIVPENITLYLIGGQVVVFGMAYAYPSFLSQITLSGGAVLAGEYWRLGTFLFIPITMSVFFAAFAWHLYWMYGTVLEREWGVGRYALYLMIGYLCTLLAAFWYPMAELTNAYLYGSLFLAFAYLYPDFTLNLFFILPVKVKWLALLTWVGYALAVVGGSPATRMVTILSVVNFGLFFGKDLYLLTRYKARQRGATVAFESLSCATCGATKKDRKIFYYCDDCTPSTCYCDDHIDDHEHIS